VIWLAERSVPDAVGVSNSDQQILIARSSARQRGLDCRFIQADFHHFTSSSSYHAASAVESFSHSPDPGLFFRNTAGLLKEGGLLILVDDFIPPGHEFYGPARTWLDRFRRGWRLHSLLAVEQVVTMAGEAGFKLIENKDLTGYIRNRWWNTLPLLPLAMVRHRSPLLGNFAGGISLRCCTLRGYTRYLMLVFRLSRSPAGG
jgi:cyclopropane fatty-acyl-phospholipid synthase-like methyltransferase